MKTLYEIVEFMFALIGLCFVLVCLSLALSDTGCLKINNYITKGCAVVKENK